MVGDSGAIYATVAMTVLLLVFAEVLPKTVAINYPDRMSLAVARVVAFFVAIFGPSCSCVDAIVRGALYLFGLRLDAETSAALRREEELKSAVDLLHQEGGVARADRDMFGGLLDLKELTVSDVMVHRTKMLRSTPICRSPTSCAKWSPRPITRVPLVARARRQHRRRAARQGPAARA